MRVIAKSVFTAICISLSVTAFADGESIKRGHLVIVGGAMKAGNAPLHQRIGQLGGDGATVAVLPTASGVPEESGPLTVQDFQSHGVPATLIDITFRNPEEAANPGKAEQIRAHRAIFFTGGDQARIMGAFRPESGDTVGYAALVQVLAEGGVIAGTSAGAAMMSDPCILWGNSGEALLIGNTEAEDRGVLVGRGMGFFPYGLTDQHFIRRGRLGRLIAALEITGQRWGFGVEENRALEVDLSTHTMTAISGPRGIVVVDMANATRDDLHRRGVRVSILGDGDLLDGSSGLYKPNTTLRPIEVVPASHDGSVAVYDGEIWGDYRVADAIAQLVTAREVRSSDPNFEVVFSADEKTRLYLQTPISGSPDPSTLDYTAINVLVEIIPRDHADAARKALQQDVAGN
jgi:cyanophycinase